nr:hypothetical protein [Tanacetum cinerariifolium]
ALNQATVLEAKKDEEILRLRATPPEFSSFFRANSRAWSGKLSTNEDLTPFVIASEHNEEMVNAEVDVSDPKMTDDTVVAKSRHYFVQGISVTLEDVVGLVEVGSRRTSSGPNDVMVVLSAGEKGDGLVPSYVVGDEAVVNPSGFRISFSLFCKSIFC